ncbi:histidine kinase [Tumebacillus avium]|uniref:Histidine kinase n=1 Tax=Tumebacillus avium TaxID=1903704 RepID=A0A1Y0IW21_9BACL|nr:histidine kinase [Tumebacillus avium]
MFHHDPGTSASHQNVRIVGLGASAGGLEALEAFFEGVPDDIPAAFVVVQHVSPNYKSFMSDLLSRRTGMAIQTAESGMLLRSNHVYLIPPNTYMTVEAGRLQLTEYHAAEGMHVPIDVFFASLAAAEGNRAIGIILSGTGSDGTRGIREIHKAGGMVLVQDEESAEFAGMPQSARLTGMVDFVLSPSAMAHQVSEVLLATGRLAEEDDEVTNDEHLLRILMLVKQQSGADFTGYKKAGVLRRVERRMQLCGRATIQEYAQHLTEDANESNALQNDLLIGVTYFFRDPEAFALLYQKVIPEIVEHKLQAQEEDIRIWVAGCSTGEEAYTFAMLFRQYLYEREIDLNIRIFATDLDQESIQYASQGSYTPDLTKAVPKTYLDRYFVKKGDLYQVSKEIRKMVVFAPHNIIKDPPFVNLDLVSCRNMMIYFQTDVQHKLLSLFHFALRTEGFLFLGPSESIGKLTNLYTPLNKKWNLYRCLEQPNPTLTGAFGIPVRKKESVSRRAIQPRADYQTVKRADDLYATLLDEFMGPAIIIDQNQNVVHTFGDLGRYMTVPRGRMNFHVHKMVNAQLSVILSTGLHKVRKDQTTVTYKDIQLTDAEGVCLNLTIKPFSSDKYLGWTMIIFEEVESRPELVEHVYHVEHDLKTNMRIRDLERELQYAQESLQATVEELETSNEELQSTNEELIASNEELQSTNEELQSVNEELISVNTEHQRKIQELTELNNDMDNFLISTKIGTIFLDHNMYIRRFTPSVTEIINLLEVDIGRPIHHISHKLLYGDLYEDAKQVLTTNITLEKEIQCIQGRWYSMGILPYRTTENYIKGVVITFVDITDLKMANKELKKLSYAIQQSPGTVLITDVTGMVEYVNPKFVEQTGYELDEMIGKHLRDLFADPFSEEAYQQAWEALQLGGKWSGEIRNRRRNGEVFWEEAAFLPIRNEEGAIIHFLKAAQDITEQKKTEELLRKSEMHSAVGQLAAGIAHEIRNPLTSLKGFLQLIQAEGEKNEAYIKIMLSEFTRIETIINELLLLSKPHVLNFKSEDALVILHDVLTLFESQALLNQVTMHRSLTTVLPEIYCVDNQIKQVLINLLKNAIEAMPSGGNIYVSATQHSDSAVLISIEDEGVGIPEEKIQRLGEPFFTTKETGTGLGMMVSNKIIENHNGSITVTSKVDVGTKVEILLPVANR